MKYYAILNNYSIGSYAYDCQSLFIYKEQRLDRNHTVVFWNLLENGKQLLDNVLGGNERLKPVEEDEDVIIEKCKIYLIERNKKYETSHSKSI